MKLLLAITIITAAFQTSLSLPASQKVGTFFGAFEEFSKSQVNKSERMVSNVLQHVPDTPAYEVHREKLHEFLQKTRDFNLKQDSCAEKLFNFSRYVESFLKIYEGASASAEHKEILKLLVDNGLRDIQNQAQAFGERISSGELVTILESSDADSAYAKFLEKQC